VQVSDGGDASVECLGRHTGLVGLPGVATNSGFTPPYLIARRDGGTFELPAMPLTAGTDMSKGDIFSFALGIATGTALLLWMMAARIRR